MASARGPRLTLVSGFSGGPVTVGVDVGTTAVKAVTVDAEGTVVARVRLPHEVRRPEPGAFEHDADEVWRDDVVAALAAVAGDLDVRGVQVAAMVPSLAAVGPDGRAVGPGLLYGDHRGVDRAADAGPGDAGELLAFLAWHRAASDAATGFWPAQAVANHALAGRAAIDPIVAITAAPLYGADGWDADLAATVGVGVDALPEVTAGSESVGRISEGLPAAGAAVGGGTIDAYAEQLVAGAEEPGDVLVLCGTTLITWVVTTDWAEADGLWTVPHSTRGRCLVGGPSNAGGLFLEAVRRWMGPVGPDEVAAVDPADLPVWLPYVRGERCPLHRRDLRASVSGVSGHHGPAELLAAAYEASAFVARHLLDRARAAGADPQRIVATGGGTQSGPWMQALADVTGLPVSVSAVPEGAALGAAHQARKLAGLEVPRAREWARTARTVDPRAAWAEPLEERYERFLSETNRAVEQAGS